MSMSKRDKRFFHVNRGRTKMKKVFFLMFVLLFGSVVIVPRALAESVPTAGNTSSSHMLLTDDRSLFAIGPVEGNTQKEVATSYEIGAPSFEEKVLMIGIVVLMALSIVFVYVVDCKAYTSYKEHS